MQKPLIFALILCLTLIQGVGAESDELALARTLSIGTSDWEPITSPTMKGNGIAIEVVRAAYSAVSQEIEITFYPWKRAELLLQQGKLDAIVPYTITLYREQMYDFSKPVLILHNKFFYLKHNVPEFSFQRYSDLRPYRLGGILGFFYESLFKEAELQVEYVQTNKQHVGKLMAGRVDIIPMVQEVGWYHIKKYYPDRIDEVATMPFEPPDMVVSDEDIAARLMTLKTNPESAQIRAGYNRGIDIIKKSGVYQDILEKYRLD